MLVYLVVFVLAVMASQLAERVRSDVPRRLTLAATFVVVLLVGVSALRWRVGTDYWTYEQMFPRLAAEIQQNLSPLDEPGLSVIAWAAMGVTNDTAVVFAVAAVITVGLTVRTLWKWSPAFAFSIALYILSGAWHGSFNGVRQYLACAVLFAAHRFIVDRRLGRWVVAVLIAALFHVSAVIAVLLYFVPTKRTSVAIQLGVLALGVLGVLNAGTLLEFIAAQTGQADLLDNMYVSRGINPLRIAFAFVPLVCFWLLRNREKIVEAGAGFYVNMLAVYSATYITSATSAYMARFTIYALPFVAIGLAWATETRDVRERALMRGIMLCIFAVFFYVEVSGTANLRDFQWIFQRP